LYSNFFRRFGSSKHAYVKLNSLGEVVMALCHREGGLVEIGGGS